MKTFEEIRDSYVEKTINYYDKCNKLEETISKAQAKLKKLQSNSPSWIQNLLVPLAKELKERLGLKAYEIYGPFGCECETSLYLSNYGKDGNIEITKVNTLSLTVRPHWKHNLTYSQVMGFELTYRTGETTNEYAKGTIGELNGLNDVYAPLPTTIEEIIKLLRLNEH